MSSSDKRKPWQKIKNFLAEQFFDAPSYEENLWAKAQFVGPKQPPIYQPEKWSEEPFVSRNNCYSYALNHLSPYYVLEPGFIACVNGGLPYQDLKKFIDETYYETPYQEFGALLTKYAEMDGLTFLGDKPKEKEGYYLVALYTRDGICDISRDYHWLRLDQDQKWSHKPGGTEVVRDVQIMFRENIKDIFDPREALYPDLNLPDGYTDFIGYFHVPMQGIDFDDRALHTIRKKLRSDMNWGRRMPDKPAFK